MFFAATYAELRGAFPDSKRPLPKPSLRTVVNPFTGKTDVRAHWLPDPTDEEPVTRLEGQSVGYRVASLAHVDVEADVIELATALAWLMGGDEQEWEARIGNPPALVDPRTEAHEWHVWQLPDEVVVALIALASNGAASEPAVKPTLASDEDTTTWLRSVAVLAVDARASGRRLYFWC